MQGVRSDPSSAEPGYQPDLSAGHPDPHECSLHLIPYPKNQLGPVIRVKDQNLDARSFTNYLDYFRQILKGSNQTIISYRHSTILSLIGTQHPSYKSHRLFDQGRKAHDSEFRVSISISLCSQ